MSFCDPQTEGIPKSASAMSLAFPSCCNSFLQKNKAQLFHLSLNQKHCKNTTVLHSKIGGFVPCVIIVIVRDFRQLLSLLIHLDIPNLFSQQLPV